MIQEVWDKDCLDAFKALPDLSVDLILTDIPYGEVNRESNGLRNLNKGIADTMLFDLGRFLSECCRVCRGSIYIFCGTEQVSFIRQLFVSEGVSSRHCVWEKTNPSPMNGQHIWLSSIENCIFAKKPKATFNEHCKSCVWRFPNGRSKSHPTEKPLKLFEYIIRTSSNEGDLVFDPCAGSGTTGVAAKSLGRQFIVNDNFPDYVDLMKNRIFGSLVG